MFRRCASVAALAAALICIPHPVSAQAALAYHLDDLGSFGGGDLVGLAINNNGDIAGYGYLPNGSVHAFRWTKAGGLEDLGANGGWLSQAAGINDNGDVVGVYLDLSNNPHGFVAPRGGVMRDLRTPDRQIVRVNSITNDGRMTGMLYSYTPYFQVHAFRTLLDGTLEDLGDTVYASVGWDINESGQVTGYEASTVDNNVQAGFRFSDGTGKVSLGTLGGKRSSGMSINASGVVAGWSEVPTTSIWSRAFRAIPGRPIEDLGTLSGAGAAAAEAINDNGTIVGWSSGRYWMTGFVYTDADGMVDLNSRLMKSDPAPPLTEATGVNNSGQIVVLYRTSVGGYGTVRLTPVIDTEPPAILSASITPDLLYPPNEQMVPASVTAFAVDDLDPAPVCGITTVANSEEPATGSGPDVQIVDAYSVLLRSARLGSGTGRTYTVTVGCRDASGNTATTQLLVRVPHDQGKLD